MNLALEWYRASIPLAWPVAVIVVVIVLRRQLTALMRRMVKATVAGATFEFEEQGDEVRERLQDAFRQGGEPPVATFTFGAEGNPLEVMGVNTDMPSYTSGSNYPPGTPLRVVYAERAVENPLNAILEAYLHLETWFDKTLMSHQLSPWMGFVKKGVPEMATDAYKAGLISEQSSSTIRGLSIMRDLAIKKRDKVQPHEAEEYLLLMDGTMYALNNEVQQYDKDTGQAETA